MHRSNRKNNSGTLRLRKQILRKNELYRIIHAFFNEPATMRMVEVKTGILRPNICRYVARLKRKGQIKLTGYGLCPFTKHLAGFYTTNLKEQNWFNDNT